MRRLYVLIFLTIIGSLAFAQNKQLVDKEKLFDLYQTQKYSEAANYLTSIYGNEITDFKLITQIGYCYLMGGNTVEAEKLYAKANQIQPENLSVLSSLASIYLRRGNVEKAKTFYQDLIRLDSTNFNVYKQLAALHTEAFSRQKLNYLKQANKLNPLDADVVFDLSDMYLKMHLLALADSILKPALEADSTNIQLLKVQLPLQLASEKYRDAIQTGEKLFALGDSSNFVLNNLGKVYYLEKRFQKGLDYFKKVSISSDDSEVLFYNMALCYRGLEDFVTAANFLKKAINAGISKNTLLYYTKMGESFEQAGKFEDAVDTYKKGAFFDKNGNLLYILAQIYDTKLKQKTNAIQTYNQVLKILPETEGNKPVRVFINKRIEELR